MKNSLGFVLGLGVFGLVVAVSLQHLPPATKVSFGPVFLLLLFGIPATVWVLAVEFMLLARMLGGRVGMHRALKVSAVGALANNLPVPGALIVRAEALRRQGIPLRKAGWSSVLLGVLWVSLALMFLGGLLYPDRFMGLALMLGIGGSAIVTYLIWRVAGSIDVVIVIIAVTVLKILISVITTFLALMTLVPSPLVLDAAVLSTAIPISTVVGIFPGGMGIREVLAAMLSDYVSIAPSIAALASAVARSALLLDLMVVWVIVWRCGRGLRGG